MWWNIAKKASYCEVNIVGLYGGKNFKVTTDHSLSLHRQLADEQMLLAFFKSIKTTSGFLCDQETEP